MATPFPRQLTVVDLFSGSGSATKAFKDRGHRVITVDINPKLKPDIVADVRYLPFADGFRPDVVWASPPCQDFSTMNFKASRRNKAGGWPEAGMETVAAAHDAIAYLNPRWWVLENVVGAKKWFGAPTAHYGSVYLWGRFPPFDAPPHRKGFVERYKRGRTNDLPNDGVKAAIPYSISRALCLAIELWEAP